MKRILVTTLLMFSITNYAQTYTIEDKALTGVFEAQGKTKAQIFSSINKWISINYNSGKSVTQLSDGEAGNIVVKGINEVSYANNMKIIIPNNKFVPDIVTLTFNDIIEINVKDNKFRINYKLIDLYIAPTPTTLLNDSTVIPNYINLNGTPESVMTVFNASMDSSLKKGFIGKEKRDKYILSIKPTFDTINLNLINNIKATMLSIQAAVNSTTKDTW